MRYKINLIFYDRYWGWWNNITNMYLFVCLFVPFKQAEIQFWIKIWINAICIKCFQQVFCMMMSTYVLLLWKRHMICLLCCTSTKCYWSVSHVLIASDIYVLDICIYLVYHLLYVVLFLHILIVVWSSSVSQGAKRYRTFQNIIQFRWIPTFLSTDKDFGDQNPVINHLGLLTKILPI